MRAVSGTHERGSISVRLREVKWSPDHGIAAMAGPQAAVAANCPKKQGLHGHPSFP